MKYICNVDLKSSFPSILFGYTENHYIDESDKEGFINVRLIYIWFSFAGEGFKFKDEKFDPGNRLSLWVVKQKNIFNSFDEAKVYFFKSLFKQ